MLPEHPEKAIGLRHPEQACCPSDHRWKAVVGRSAVLEHVRRLVERHYP